MFLHNRPKMFIEHCLKRLGEVPSTQIHYTESSFVVNGYNLDMEIRSCSCPDFQRHCWPCKHMLAVMCAYQGYSWDFLPSSYRTLPCFVLDDMDEQAEYPYTSPTIMKEKAGIRMEMIEFLKEITDNVYVMDNEIIMNEMSESLKLLARKSRENVPTIEWLPVRKRRSKVIKMNTNLPDKNNEHQGEEDEVSKGWCTHSYELHYLETEN